LGVRNARFKNSRSRTRVLSESFFSNDIKLTYFLGLDTETFFPPNKKGDSYVTAEGQGKGQSGSKAEGEGQGKCERTAGQKILAARPQQPQRAQAAASQPRT
jgi:hypothetical protein